MRFLMGLLGLLIGGLGLAQTLVYGLSGQPQNLDPATHTDTNGSLVQTQIYNTLVGFVPGSTELAPELATDWSSDPEAKVWTFKLREGVLFHDGTPFNAEAVKFNFERWWDPSHPAGFRAEGKTYPRWLRVFGPFKGEEGSLLGQVEVIDPYTVRFHLSQPFAAFPAALGAQFGIASPKALTAAGAAYGAPGSNIVGTGPFVFKSWSYGEQIVLEKNPDYWRSDLPKAQEIVFRFIAEPASRLAELRAGSIDLAGDLSPDDWDSLEADSNLTILVRASLNVGYLALNPAFAPFADPRVREAVDLALDQAGTAAALYGELGVGDGHFLPPSLAEFRAPDFAENFDPARARELLAEAGYPQGFDLELWYMPVSRPYFPSPAVVAEIIAANLADIGIRVQLRTEDWAAYLADVDTPPGFPAFILGWTAPYPDPDAFFWPHFAPGHTGYLGGFQNPQLLELMNQGRTSADPAERAQIYAQAEQLVAADRVRLVLIHASPLLAHRVGVTGWLPSPMGQESLEGVSKASP